MREKRNRGLLECSLFCLTGVFLMGALPIALSGPMLHLRAIAQLGIALYFFLRRSPLFGPSLFMLLLSATFLIRFPVPLWLFNLLLATAVYFAVYVVYPPIRKNTRWLTPGRLSPGTVLAIAAVVGLSTGALIVWASGGLRAVGVLSAGGSTSANESLPGTFAPDIPRFSNPLLLAAGITGFALLNGAGEEVMFRGIYWDGLASLFRSPCTVVLTQALFFGLCHFRGFPSGPIGIGLSFLYGAVMGLIRHRTGGILAPVIAHVLTDAMIAIVVLTSALQTSAP